MFLSGDRKKQSLHYTICRWEDILGCHSGHSHLDMTAELHCSKLSWFPWPFQPSFCFLCWGFLADSRGTFEMHLLRTGKGIMRRTVPSESNFRQACVWWNIKDPVLRIFNIFEIFYILNNFSHHTMPWLEMCFWFAHTKRKSVLYEAMRALIKRITI